MSTPLIRQVKAATPGADLVIIDSPPGTSCPVIESVRSADLVLLVTEPTPFGLNDLKAGGGNGPGHETVAGRGHQSCGLG